MVYYLANKRADSSFYRFYQGCGERVQRRSRWFHFCVDGLNLLQCDSGKVAERTGRPLQWVSWHGRNGWWARGTGKEGPDACYFIPEEIHEIIALFHSSIWVRGGLWLEKTAERGVKLLGSWIFEWFSIGLLIFPKGLLVYSQPWDLTVPFEDTSDWLHPPNFSSVPGCWTWEGDGVGPGGGMAVKKVWQKLVCRVSRLLTREPGFLRKCGWSDGIIKTFSGSFYGFNGVGVKIRAP